MGGDIGREKHLTVFWIAELVGDVLIARKIIRLAKTPYHVQLKVASDLLANNNIVRACIDATGIGDMLVETLQKQFGEYRVEKIKFTSNSKEHLASITLGRFEDRCIRVPDEPKIRESFHTVRKTITAAGNTRYDATQTDDGHADDFWACACCNEAAWQPEVKPECILI